MDPTAETFRALARSSPWRWSTLRLVLTRRPARSPDYREGWRAWIRRPYLLRVEDVEGRLIEVVRDRPASVGLMTADGRGKTVRLRPAAEIEPTFGPDGLVRQRPCTSKFHYDAPFFRDYHWVAMLDPVEFADGHDGRVGVDIEQASAIDHHGRPAWEAIVRPTSDYWPRCPCCALLPTAAIDGVGARRPLLEQGGADAPVMGAQAYSVRLDVQTGVCVFSEELGGSWHGWGHDVAIEAVDEPMADALFDSTSQPRR